MLGLIVAYSIFAPVWFGILCSIKDGDVGVIDVLASIFWPVTLLMVIGVVLGLMFK